MNDLEHYLTEELRLSEKLALRKIHSMRNFIYSLMYPVDYPICRFNQWCLLGYRCAVFDKTWIFAYEEFENGVIIRDMAHTSVLIK